jgi:Peptidase_C39 like family
MPPPPLERLSPFERSLLEWLGFGFLLPELEPAKTPQEESESPYASEFQAKDRVTDAQYQDTMDELRRLGFDPVVLPQNAVYFSQNDKRWADHKYPKGQKKDGPPPDPDRALGGKEGAGCAPTALAIADATLRGTRTTPPEVADFAVQNKASGNPPAAGSHTTRLVEKWAEQHGLHHEHTKDVDTLVEGLDKGGVAVINVKRGVFNSGKFTDVDDDPKSGGGHEIVVTGYAVKDGKEWFFVANPGKDGSAVKMQGDGVQVDKDLHHAAGRVMVSREVLEKYVKNGIHVLSNP